MMVIKGHAKHHLRVSKCYYAVFSMLALYFFLLKAYTVVSELALYEYDY